MERVRALTDQLEAGITGLFQSGQYAAYLQSLSKLHHYSYGNIFLIKLQCPHASMVLQVMWPGTKREHTVYWQVIWLRKSAVY